MLQVHILITKFNYKSEKFMSMVREIPTKFTRQKMSIANAATGYVHFVFPYQIILYGIKIIASQALNGNGEYFQIAIHTEKLASMPQVGDPNQLDYFKPWMGSNAGVHLPRFLSEYPRGRNIPTGTISVGFNNAAGNTAQVNVEIEFLPTNLKVDRKT